MKICDGCRMAFNEQKLEEHNCEGRVSQLPERELVERVYQSGACTEEFYKQELARLERGETWDVQQETDS